MENKRLMVVLIVLVVVLSVGGYIYYFLGEGVLLSSDMECMAEYNERIAACDRTYTEYKSVIYLNVWGRLHHVDYFLNTERQCCHLGALVLLDACLGIDIVGEEGIEHLNAWAECVEDFTLGSP